MPAIADLMAEHATLGDQVGFPASIVTLGAEGWNTVDEAHTRTPSCLHPIN
ncbi:MAG TPA: hypothetical protein VFQ17_03970 [Nocardioides sp.]|nr:hypothetical protein [Nocardioides sp.]